MATSEKKEIKTNKEEIVEEIKPKRGRPRKVVENKW